MLAVATPVALPAIDSQIMESCLRLSLAAVFGGLVGLERELRGRQAGFRTYILVCVGSALVMLVSTQFALHQWIAQTANQGVNINLDPARIAYGVMTGIGFLGAGAIVHAEGGLVRGLTTAAAMWCVAAIGLSVGFGMYSVSTFTTIIVLGVLWVLDYVEDILPRSRTRTITLRREYTPGCIEQAIEFIANTAGIRVLDTHFRRSENLSHADIDLRISYKRDPDYRALERKIDASEEYDLVATREV